MSITQILLLAVLAFCFTASGFLSGSETAVVALPRERLHQLRHLGRRGAHLAELADDPERTIGTVLVANNFVNILATSIATVLAVDLIDESIGPIISTFVVTAIVLIAGEITPKTLAARNPEGYGLTVATGLWWLMRLLEPISKVFRAASYLILRMFGVRQGDSRPVTEADVRALALLGEESGEIEREEREIIDALFEAADRPVREVMTPRVDIVTFEAPVPLGAVRRAVAETGHSRYPVIPPGGDLDSMLGVLYVKDLLRTEGEESPEDIQRLLRQPHYVPESAPILAVLGEIRLRKIGFAVVLDEHGGAEGIVTTKNLVSALVGELQDEYDPGTPVAAPTGERTWTANGSLPVEELSEEIGCELPDGPYTTVGGLFLYIAGDIPQEGDSIDVEDVRLTIESMDRLRIAKLRVELLG